MGMTSVSPRISVEEYDAFLALFKDDPDFPPAFGEWVERMMQEDAKREARGLLIQEVIVHPQEFTEWCSYSGLYTGFQLLTAFAVSKAVRHR